MDALIAALVVAPMVWWLAQQPGWLWPAVMAGLLFWLVLWALLRGIAWVLDQVLHRIKPSS